MKVIYLIPLFFLLIHTNSQANEFFEKTSACRMEVKILGPDLLDEDESCLWLEDNKELVYDQCIACREQLELIKEASRGHFDY